MQLHFKEYGQGRGVVLLHGLFGSSDNWHFIAMRLAQQFHVFSLDLRNHGQSPHSDEMNYPVMADDVAEFLDAHHLDNADVLGHSLGGKVAMQLALNHPARVGKLIVADMAPRVYPPEHAKILSTLRALDLKAFHSRRQIEETLAPGIPDLIVRRFLLKNLAQDAGGSFRWKMNLQGLFENYPHLCEAVTGTNPFAKPALFLRGEKSSYISNADIPEIRRLFPQSEIQTIPSAGHWVHADAPEAFAQRVLKFVSSAQSPAV